MYSRNHSKSQSCIDCRCLELSVLVIASGFSQGTGRARPRRSVPSGRGDRSRARTPRSGATVRSDTLSLSAACGTVSSRGRIAGPLRRRSVITLLLGLAFGCWHQAALARDPLPCRGTAKQPGELLQQVVAAESCRCSRNRATVVIPGHACGFKARPGLTFGGKKATPYLRPLGERAFLIRSATASAVLDGA